MHLSNKLNDVVYQKNIILDFSLFLTVRKLHSFAFIKKKLTFKLYFYALLLTLNLMEEDKLMFCHSRMTVKRHAS